jgi:hypothetical protein
MFHPGSYARVVVAHLLRFKGLCNSLQRQKNGMSAWPADSVRHGDRLGSESPSRDLSPVT